MEVEANTSSKNLEQASDDGDAEYEEDYDDAYYEDDNRARALQPANVAGMLSVAAFPTQAALLDTPTKPSDVLLTGQLVKADAGKRPLKKI